MAYSAIEGHIASGQAETTVAQFNAPAQLALTDRNELMQRARQALSGYVFAAIGTSTHYHTDWVVPYWSSSLAKVAKVHSHIFYRRWRPGEHQLSS